MSNLNLRSWTLFLKNGTEKRTHLMLLQITDLQLKSLKILRLKQNSGTNIQRTGLEIKRYTKGTLKN